MKKSIMILAAIAVAGLTGNAFAQNSASANGTATGKILTPISIVPSSPNSLLIAPGTLAFGNVISGNGTVTEAGGSCTYSNSNMNPGAAHGQQNNAFFSVSGDASESFSWSTTINGGLPSGLTLTSLSPATGTNVSLSGGTVVLSIGGVLSDDGTAATGSFSTSNAFTVNVMYN